MQYEANKPIPLAQTRIRFDVSDNSVDRPAKVALRMLPDPRLVIECDLDLHNSNVSLLDFQQDYVTATIHNQKIEFIVGQCPFHFGPEEFLVELSLFPEREPVSIHHTGDSLSSVEFVVLNFPVFQGKQEKNVESKGSCSGVGTVSIQVEPWIVDITAVPNFADVRKELAATGGYGITHSGTVRRADGDGFRVSEVEQLLGGLSLFLSFARGAYCGLTLVKGKSRDGEVAWERWGTDRVTGWFSPHSWFDIDHGHLLAEVFPGFWHQYKKQEKDLRVAITLYLDSNLGRSHGVGLDGGLILTQAALERMAHNVGGKGTGKRIAKALIENGITKEALPILTDSCPELARLATEHGWEHGPHALVEIRNSVVHPRQSYGEISAMAFYEAWNLGQWYLELTFLSLFGACGEYSNRLTKKWVGEVEPLGQWLVKNRPHIIEENE